MGEHETEKARDLTEFAGMVDDFREMISALVAGLVADGFTEREARALVAGFWAANIKKADDQ